MAYSPTELVTMVVDSPEPALEVPVYFCIKVPAGLNANAIRLLFSVGDTFTQQ